MFLDINKIKLVVFRALAGFRTKSGNFFFREKGLKKRKRAKKLSLAAERRDAQDEFHSAAQARAWADGDFDADHGFAFDGVGRPAHC